MQEPPDHLPEFSPWEKPKRGQRPPNPLAWLLPLVGLLLILGATVGFALAYLVVPGLAPDTQATARAHDATAAALAATASALDSESTGLRGTALALEAQGASLDNAANLLGITATQLAQRVAATGTAAVFANEQSGTQAALDYQLTQAAFNQASTQAALDYQSTQAALAAAATAVALPPTPAAGG
jgi:hypothetical protein